MTLGSRITLHLLVPDVVPDETQVRSKDEKASHNSEKEDYFKELEQLAEELNFTPVIHKMTLTNMNGEIDTIPNEDIIFNLCDGSDVDGVCGPSVAAYLEQKGHPNVVGCDLLFINNTLTKAGMKELFLQNMVSCPPGFLLTKENVADLDKEVTAWGMTYPLFVKVSDSYGSVGIDDQSVCHDPKGLHDKVNSLLAEFPNVVIEEYIDGPEFSVLISGNCRDPTSQVIVYPPAERAFNKELPRFQRFISFLRNWDESLLAHHYAPVTDSNDFQGLQDLARRAYMACSGNSFGRVDVRKRESSGKLYVLEVNASCGIGKGTSSDFILGLAGQSTREFFQILLSSALKPPADEESNVVGSPVASEGPHLVADKEINAEPTTEAEIANDTPAARIIPPAVESRVNELLKNPSLGVFPNPVVHVIVAAVHMENEIPEPEMSLRETWGKDLVYVSELEASFRSLGYDPIVHLHHFDDIEATLAALSPENDLVVNACLGQDGADVAELLEKNNFKAHIGLNAAFFRHSRNRKTMRDHLKANRLRTPKGIVASHADKDHIESLLIDAELSPPFYAKPAIAHRNFEGDHAGRKLRSIQELKEYINEMEENVVVEAFVNGKVYKALVAGDGRDSRADIIVLPAIQVIKPPNDDVRIEEDDSANDAETSTPVITSNPVSPQVIKGSTSSLRRRPSAFIPRLYRRMTTAPFFLTTPEKSPTYQKMGPNSLLLQLDIQDVARRSFTAVEGSCYGIVTVIQREDSDNDELVVLGVSSDIRFGENGDAGAILALANLNAESLWSWLLKRVNVA
ncbi:D-alanine---D-alanine ligase [Synchytrium endobioticum]|uniref:D-alanine---D-alanine ligase n=1 Tax=Synchytrium endobioticum TaxID=286115 RepID=A0A507DPC9_9FUNG|nr:D-alanine---D-alanine ligase [Synchytrium endobioticum]